MDVCVPVCRDTSDFVEKRIRKSCGSKDVTQQKPGFFTGDARRPSGAHSLGRRWTGSLLYLPELPEPAYS